MAWRICDVAGRNASGRMMVSEIINTVELKDGFSEDVDRVIEIEKINRRLNVKKKPGSEKPDEYEQAE